MSDMLKKYEESTAPIVEDARAQSEGDKAVNFFDEQNVYQRDFTTGAATPGADPTGNFTDPAKAHYDQEIIELSNSHHKSNASNIESHYATKHENAAGIVYQSTVK